MTVNDKYILLLKMLKTYFKTLGFKYKKPMFYCKKGDNYGMLSFQKSMTSTRKEIRFTINLGVSSKVIFDFDQSNLIEFYPSMMHACWSLGLGTLINKDEFWWIINADTNLELLFSELSHCFTYFAVPEIEKNIDDESLIQRFTKTQQLIKLSVLLKSAGRFSELKSVIQMLEELKLTAYNTGVINFTLRYLRSG